MQIKGVQPFSPRMGRGCQLPIWLACLKDIPGLAWSIFSSDGGGAAEGGESRAPGSVRQSPEVRCWSWRRRSRRKLSRTNSTSVARVDFQLTPHPHPLLASGAFVWVKILGRPGDPQVRVGGTYRTSSLPTLPAPAWQ